MRHIVKRARRRALAIWAAGLLTAGPSDAQEVGPTREAVEDVVEAAVLREIRPHPPFQLSIRLVEPRTAFRSGEPIDIEASFDPALGLPAGGILDRPCGGGWTALQVVFEPGEGVVPASNPVCEALANRVSAGVPGCSPYPTAIVPGRWPSYVRRFTLTDQYRFERPGRYRVHVRLRRWTFFGLRYEQSNELTLDILPRNPAWEGQTAADAERELVAGLRMPALRRETGGCGAGHPGEDGHDSRAQARRAVARLRALGTADAMGTLVRLLARRTEFTHTFPAGVIEALYAAADIEDVAGAMRREIDDPHNRVSAGFIRDLAAIEATRRHESGTAAWEREYLAHVEFFCARRSVVLAQLPGALEQQIRSDLAGASAPWSDYLRGVVVLHEWPVETARVFRTLTGEEQRHLLTTSGRRFSYRTFVPLFRELAERSPNPGLRAIALRHWAALDPDGAPSLARRRPERALAGREPVAPFQLPQDGRPLAITAFPPSGEQRWPIFHVGDTPTSLDGLLARLLRMPRGTRVTLAFARRAEHAEQWPAAECDTVLDFVRSRAAVRGIEVTRRAEGLAPQPFEVPAAAPQPAQISPDGRHRLELLGGGRVGPGVAVARLRVTTIDGAPVAVAPVWGVEPHGGDRPRILTCDRWGWIGDDRIFCEGRTEHAVLAHRVFEARTGVEQSEAHGERFVWSPDRRFLARVVPAPAYPGEYPNAEHLAIDAEPVYYYWLQGARRSQFRSRPAWSSGSDHLAIVEQVHPTRELSVLMVMPSRALRRYRLPWRGDRDGSRLPLDVHLRWEGSTLVVDYEGRSERLSVLP